MNQPLNQINSYSNAYILDCNYWLSYSVFTSTPSYLAQTPTVSIHMTTCHSCHCRCLGEHLQQFLIIVEITIVFIILLCFAHSSWTQCFIAAYLYQVILKIHYLIVSDNDPFFSWFILFGHGISFVMPARRLGQGILFPGRGHPPMEACWVESRDLLTGRVWKAITLT